MKIRSKVGMLREGALFVTIITNFKGEVLGGFQGRRPADSDGGVPVVLWNNPKDNGKRKYLHPEVLVDVIEDLP